MPSREEIFFNRERKLSPMEIALSMSEAEKNDIYLKKQEALKKKEEEDKKLLEKEELNKIGRERNNSVNFLEQPTVINIMKKFTLFFDKDNMKTFDFTISYCYNDNSDDVYIKLTSSLKKDLLINLNEFDDILSFFMLNMVNYKLRKNFYNMKTPEGDALSPITINKDYNYSDVENGNLTMLVSDNISNKFLQKIGITKKEFYNYTYDSYDQMGYRTTQPSIKFITDINQTDISDFSCIILGHYVFDCCILYLSEFKCIVDYFKKNKKVINHDNFIIYSRGNKIERYFNNKSRILIRNDETISEKYLLKNYVKLSELKEFNEKKIKLYNTKYNGPDDATIIKRLDGLQKLFEKKLLGYLGMGYGKKEEEEEEMTEQEYKMKYLKYKQKYLELQNKLKIENK